jgi:hypothetical protein
MENFSTYSKYLLYAVAAFLAALSIFYPGLIASNAALNAFISGGLIPTLAIIVSINVVATASLNQSVDSIINSLEKITKETPEVSIESAKNNAKKVKKNIRDNIFYLLGYLAASALIVITKYYVSGDYGISAINSVAVYILFDSFRHLSSQVVATLQLSPLMIRIKDYESSEA